MESGHTAFEKRVKEWSIASVETSRPDVFISITLTRMLIDAPACVCVGVPWRDCFHSHIPKIISQYNGFGKHPDHKCVDHRMESGLIDATERVHWQHILGWTRQKVRKRCFALSYRRFSDICSLNRLYTSYVPGKSRNGCILSWHCWIKHLPVSAPSFPLKGAVLDLFSALKWMKMFLRNVLLLVFSPWLLILRFITTLPIWIYEI